MVFRGVAQFGRALRSGRRGRGFKSRHLDQSLAMTGIVRHGFLLSELNAAGGVFVLPKQVGLCFVEPKSVTLFLYAPHSKSAL